MEIPPTQRKQGRNSDHQPPTRPAHYSLPQRRILAHRSDQSENTRKTYSHGSTDEQRGPVRRVDEAVPEVPGFEPASGREHAGDNAVDHHQARPRCDEVDPANDEMSPAVERVPVVSVDKGGGDLDEEEDPFDRPSPNESVNEGRRRLRADQSNREPDAHAGDRPEDYCQQRKEFGMQPYVSQQLCIVTGISTALG